MTDEEAVEFCESRLKRLKELNRQRESLPDGKAGYKRFCAIKKEALSICDEVSEKIVGAKFSSDDISVTMKVLDLVGASIDTRDSFMPRR